MFFSGEKKSSYGNDSYSNYLLFLSSYHVRRASHSFLISFFLDLDL